jgi:hypothetical protein
VHVRRRRRDPRRRMRRAARKESRLRFHTRVEQQHRPLPVGSK